jgi:hypothetical protein
MRRILIYGLGLSLCAATVGAQDDRPEWAAKQPTVKVAKTVTPPASEASEPEPTGVREVTASSKHLIPLTTRLRYTTLVVLPDTEMIMDAISGDKEWWAIDIAQNMAYIKPAQAGAKTNLNLVTASGMVYSFLMAEGGKGIPDLKVSVLAPDGTTPVKPRFVPVAQLEAVQTELAAVRVSLEEFRQAADKRVEEVKRQAPTAVQFPFEPIPYIKPFLIKSAWQDDRFTYFRSDARELPAIYELKDGKPAVVEFRVEDHTYIVPKLMDSGYFALGKERLEFREKKSTGN